MPAPLESDLLRSFLAVCETGSLTAAAGRVGRTQSALSMQIKRLEEVVGTPLFERQPRGVVPTAAGRQLSGYARRVVDLLEVAGAALRTADCAGPVRIGVPVEFSDTALANALVRFGDLHPGAEVTVVSDYSSPLRDRFDRRELEIAILYQRPETAAGEILRVEPTVWVTSERYQQHLKRPLPVASYFGSRWCQDHMIGSLRRNGTDYRIAFECDTTMGFLSAVRAGLAVVALTRSVVPEGCRELTAEDGFPTVDLSALVMLRSAAAGPAAQRLADLVARVFHEGTN
jgi:DNA-binding transcriptional LysR family regulator